MLELFIPVKPTPKERPRVLGNGAAFTPSKTVKAERDIKTIVKAEMSKKKIDISENPIELQIIFHFESKNRGPMDKKPDLDNMIKLVMDALNGLVYKDDKQVCFLSAGKSFSSKFGIYLVVKEIMDF